MTSSMHTILIIGGTSGIGAHVAKRFHEQGKKLILTGRPGTDRLAKIEKQLPGSSTYGLDVTDVDALAGHIDAIFTKHPDIDTVWVNAGIQERSSILDPSTSSDNSYVKEITTNITAPFIIARHVIPRLHQTGKEANFLITSSGLGFVPVGKMWPVYCASKAAVHQYLVGVRQAVQDSKVNIIELVPPYVEGTELMNHQEPLNGPRGMTLDEYVNETFEKLDSTQARELKEIAPGSAGPRVDAWRSGIGKILTSSGLNG